MANTVSILKSWDVLKSILGADAVSDNGVQILALRVRLRSNRYNDHKQKYFLLESTQLLISHSMNHQSTACIPLALNTVSLPETFCLPLIEHYGNTCEDSQHLFFATYVRRESAPQAPLHHRVQCFPR